MDIFYKKLASWKSSKGLNNTELGRIIGKSEPAFRMAVKRESLTDLEKEKLENYFENSSKDRNDTEKRFEDIVAEKVYENLYPVLRRMTDELLESLSSIETDLAVIENRQKEILDKQNKTHKVVETIEKKH